MKAESTLNKVKVLLGIEVKLEEMKLENGTRFEADKFEKGKEVFIVSEDDARIPVPVGEYLTDEGKYLYVVEEGIIDEVKEEEEMEVEDKEIDEVEAEDDGKEADVEDWAGMEKRIKNLEDAIADLKSKMGEDKEYMEEDSKEESKEELSAEIKEAELSEEVKPFKHNPEAKNKVEMNLYAQNKPMNTQDRVFNKLFNNN
tara:strand:- start:140 stop:739 length:600 start_codon:yes stop_codon:yes gene_type:complete